MVTSLPSTTRDFTRDEFAALAKPYRATQTRITATSLIFTLLTMLVPTILLGCFMMYMSLSITGGLTYRSVMTGMFSHIMPLYLAIQVLYILIALVQISAVFSKSGNRSRRMFPDKRRRETVTTQITPYGIVQSSAGCSIITPWGNVVRIDEVTEAFVLQTRSLNYGRSKTGLGLGIDLVYVPKSTHRSTGPELSAELLQQFRLESATSPNYMWHADLVGSTDPPPGANTVWPPPPDPPKVAVELELPLTGSIVLPLVEASSDGTSFLFRYSRAGKFQKLQRTMVIPIVVFIDTYRYLAGPFLYWGIAGGVLLYVLLLVFTWRSKPIIGIDRAKSLITLNGKRFAAISEIHAITVSNTPTPFRINNGRMFAFINIAKSTGKPRLLAFPPYTSAYEANIIARILGQYLTASLRPSTLMEQAPETKTAQYDY